MREIKFRAWDKNENEMFYSNMYQNKTSMIYGLGNFLKECSDIEEPIMQYTGLKDKKLKEIYEGDILSHHLQGNRFVEYGRPFKNYGGYMLVSKNGMRGTLNDSDKLYEVIGNIYENTELLNK